MIDYYAHVAVLEQLRAQVPVAGGGAGPAELAQLQEFADAAAAEEGAALVGLFTDHVLTHASADGTEADLLERAGDLWKTGKDLYEGIGEVRQVVEKALQTPDEPDAADSFNQAMARMVVLLRKAKKLSEGVRQLRKDLRPLKHLPPHPRQTGLPLSDWGYGDVFLARRQDAFTRTVFSRSRRRHHRPCAGVRRTGLLRRKRHRLRLSRTGSRRASPQPSLPQPPGP